MDSMKCSVLILAILDRKKHGDITRVMQTLQKTTKTFSQTRVCL